MPTLPAPAACQVDLLPAEQRAKLIAKAKKRLAQTLAATTFAGCPMVAVAARPGRGWHLPHLHTYVVQDHASSAE